MIFAALTTLSLLISFAEAQTSCSGQNNNIDTPGSGSCMLNWRRGNTYEYPGDFEGILNEVTIYVCPTSGKRVILSNGIPDHTVVQGNPNSPCEKNWAVSMPLNPIVVSAKTEPPTRGIIAMAVNGVPAYGAQEGGSTNAVEPSPGSQITDAQFWYGHAAMDNDWHLHNPFLGQENPSENDLLGYALDGFPIYGPLSDASGLDACNGQTINGQYQYNVRTLDQVDADLDYCNGSSAETNWNYVLGCYSGTLSETEVVDSDNFSLPSDCVEDVTEPTASPTAAPVLTPTVAPTAILTASPTIAPTVAPSAAPTDSSTVGSPTPSPTISTTSICKDSTLRFRLFYNDRNMARSCDWVANKQTAMRCAADGVAAMCPSTCGTCDTCVDSDVRFKFFYNGGTKKITRSCIWVANKATVFRCATEGIFDSCRLTCGQCP